jgi:hypothetical protein
MIYREIRDVQEVPVSSPSPAPHSRSKEDAGTPNTSAPIDTRSIFPAHSYDSNQKFDEQDRVITSNIPEENKPRNNKK